MKNKWLPPPPPPRLPAKIYCDVCTHRSWAARGSEIDLFISRARVAKRKNNKFSEAADTFYANTEPSVKMKIALAACFPPSNEMENFPAACIDPLEARSAFHDRKGDAIAFLCVLSIRAWCNRRVGGGWVGHSRSQTVPCACRGKTRTQR